MKGNLQIGWKVALFAFSPPANKATILNLTESGEITLAWTFLIVESPLRRSA
jgi:hypothetical protein